MEPRKQAILDALTKFMNQRSGIEFGNYGDVKAFRAEQRSITKDLHHARTLLMAVARTDGIDADALVKAAQGAYGGRLTISDPKIRTADLRAKLARTGDEHVQRILRASIASEAAAPARVDYCTGQYFPTEYRRAVCAVLASALWEYTRETSIPAVGAYRVRAWGNRERSYGDFAARKAADARLKELTQAFAGDGTSWGHVDELHCWCGAWLTAGDWLRAHFRKEFGRAIASRWFS